MIILDYSELAAWKRCRMAHHFQYTRQVEPLKPRLDTLLGTAIHDALSRYYMHNEVLLTAYADAFEYLHAGLAMTSSDEDRELTELLYLGRDMLSHYENCYRGETNFTFIVSEYKFVVPIPGTNGEGVFKGRVDGIIVDENSNLWIVEHKTAKTFPDDRFFSLDEQTLLYQWAIQQAIAEGQVPNIPANAILSGWCYNGLRKVVPKEPALLKRGKALSVANIDTTVGVYRDTVLKHGFLLKDYDDKLVELQNRGNTFFKRIYTRRTRHEIRSIEARLQQEYLSFRDDVGYVYPNPSKLCAYCAYYDPCLETQRGGQHAVEYILDHMYKRRTHSHPSDTIGSLSIGEE